MQSGIADYDLPSLDNAALVARSMPHPVLTVLYSVAAFKGKIGCTTYNCTWVCEPGTCVSYSSTNYLLAGLLLLAHAPAGQRTWQTYDQLQGLGLKAKDYPNTHFAAQGALNEIGLSVVGHSVAYCDYQRHPIRRCDEMYTQDATILGW